MSGGKHGKPARESKDANENGRRRIRETGRRKKIQTQRVAHRLHHPNEPSPLPSAPEPVAGVDHREVVKGADLAELVKLANPAEVVKGANQAVDTIKEAVRRGQWEPVEAQDSEKSDRCAGGFSERRGRTRGKQTRARRL